MLEITNATQPNPIPYGSDESGPNLAQVITYILNENRSLHSPIQMMFHNIFRSANDLMDLLAMQWLDRVEPFVGLSIFFFFLVCLVFWCMPFIMHLYTISL